ncbi:hypothetical protein [Bacillus sp. AK128]
MYTLLILFAIALIGIVLLFTIKKRSPWKFIIVISILTIGALHFFGFRFTPSSALPMGSKVIQSIDTVYGKAILT